ncbi:MAG: ADP-ribosylglycohydrolase family protein [Ruminococcaceae bacterium]|nr:ADP-ribosylglycohydrolase family protein [Oscillospiraceae bacterium]
MAVIGAILGDISGSQYEFSRPKDLDTEHCELFTKKCEFTDDTVLTLAVKHAITNGLPFADTIRDFARRYPRSGYGERFIRWMLSTNAEPYNSFGNGSAMRCSFIGEHFDTENEVSLWAARSAECTHSHPEGVKGAVVTAMCVYMARTGASKEEIFKYTAKNYPKSDYKYSPEYKLEEYRNSYEWNEICQDSVPAAVRCFLESEDYTSFLRNVYSLPCDMDTLCAIGGGIAEEFYHGTGFDDNKLLKEYLDEYLYGILRS